MKNDGALESSHQGEFVFCHLVGDRDNCKKKIFVEGKQTIMSAIFKEFYCKWINNRTTYQKLPVMAKNNIFSAAAQVAMKSHCESCLYVRASDSWIAHQLQCGTTS